MRRPLPSPDLGMWAAVGVALSVAGAAELLNLPWLELSSRCVRPDVPLRSGLGGVDEARAGVEPALASWFSRAGRAEPAT